MRTPYLALCLVAVLATGCIRTQYVSIEHGSFHTEANARALFPSLLRAAAQMGYVIYAVDPSTGVFQVFSRTLGTRPARAPAYGAMRVNLLVVSVAGGEVRVTAIGRHVSPDGTMHPRLAEEASIFTQALEDVARGIVSVPPLPNPPVAYGGLGTYAPSAPVVSGAVALPAPNGPPPPPSVTLPGFGAPTEASESAATPTTSPTSVAPSTAAPTTISPAQRLGHP